MIKIFLTFVVALLITVTSFAQNIHHNITAEPNPEKHSIKVKDIIFIPAKFVKNKDRIEFTLNDNLKILSSEPEIQKVEGGVSEWSQLYWFKPQKKDDGYQLTIEYEGVIYDNFDNDGAEYARGFKETTGIISEKGIYLASSSAWIPDFDNSLITYKMSVFAPAGWDVVSQGKRTKQENENKITYLCTTPQEEAYLISAAFTVYEKKPDNVLLQAFLRTPDDKLADKYLKMTGVYLKMYEDMLGPYPYSKFALVENFWETGYGMPSFTLLGEKIIRFPFIIYSSYPHELLHNYWGNSVYVDYDKGNWCEGITAYMADHMLKEQRGQGADYRRNTLEKFTDFVNDENDFPLSDFINRSNPAQEAIGYGKCLMMNHMLRKQVGDEMFLKSYRKFYETNKFRRASFDDIRKAFDETTGRDFKPFFDFWVNVKGAPQLAISDIYKKETDKGYKYGFTLRQVQKNIVYPLYIPIAIYYADKVDLQTYYLNKNELKISLESNNEPLRIEVDPQFDVFRKLDKAEVPPTLSQVFGSKNGMIVLPSKSADIEKYKTMAQAWKKSQEAQGKTIEIVEDKDLKELPSNKAVWILGFENSFYNIFKQKIESPGEKDASSFKKAENEGSLVMVVNNPANPAFSVGFVGTKIPAAIPGLTRLLPHYGKYSYLGFSGNRPDNFLKGNFTAENSPLHYTFPDNKGKISPEVKLKPEPPLTR